MLLSVRTAAVLLALGASPALACPQEHSMDLPFYGQIILGSDYNLDPFRMTVQGGGPSALRDCDLGAEGLAGYDGDGIIGDRPDVVLEWLGGGRRLAFTLDFEDDTLLVIRDPEEGWHFDDNGRGHNPLIVFEDPPIGNYVVYIGGHGSPGGHTGVGDLIITETGP